MHTNGSEHSAPALIECYPHVALLALLKRDYRVPYKVSRSGKYWKAEKLTRREQIDGCSSNSKPSKPASMNTSTASRTSSLRPPR